MMVRFAFIISCARYFHWVYWVVLAVVAFLSFKSPISSCSSCIVLYWKVPRCPNRGGFVCNLFSVFCSFQHIFSFCSWTVFSIICCEAFLFCSCLFDVLCTPYIEKTFSSLGGRCLSHDFIKDVFYTLWLKFFSSFYGYKM